MPVSSDEINFLDKFHQTGILPRRASCLTP